MKCKYKLSLGVTAMIAVILPMSVFAEDQNPNQTKQNKKVAGSQQHADRAGPQTAAVSGGRSQGANAQKQSRGNSAYGGQERVSRGASGPASVQRTNVTSATSQSSQAVSRSVRNQGSQAQTASRQQVTQTQAASRQLRNQNQVTSTQQRNSTRAYSNHQRGQVQVTSNQQYNRNNNYGGNWYAANTHSDWNQNQPYYWNNHNYRWYEGGWLMIDGGFNPYYTTTVYSNGGSTVSNVQGRLADQGYYHGPIDGDFGPGTRSAIASYQSDNGLRVTGRINDPLLQSLQLE